MFFHGTGAFPHRQATASFVAKVLLEKIMSTWGTPLKLYSEQETHFTGQVLRQVYAIWSVLYRFYYTYYRPSVLRFSGMHNSIKTQLRKLVETLQIPWST